MKCLKEPSGWEEVDPKTVAVGDWEGVKNEREEGEGEEV